MNGWMNSPGHRANILNPSFTRMGIACVEAAGAWISPYWTQQFSFGPATPPTDWERIPVPTEQLSPKIEGDRVTGAQLSVNLGGALPDGTNLAYQWTADGTAITAATGSTFTPTEGQVGKKIGVQVTASNNPFFYQSTSVTVPTDTQVVLGIMTAPSAQIGGSATVGQTLSVIRGGASDFSPRADVVTYQWLRDGAEIAGATMATYTLVGADATKGISLRIRATKPNYKDATVTTGAVRVVRNLEVRRLSAADRYGTNLRVNGVYGDKGAPVFVATGAQFADALSIGPAVSLTGGTLFLTSPSGMSAQALASVKAKNPSAVYVIGGEGAVPEPVAKQLQEATGKKPQRIGGSTRYETSANILTAFFGSRTVDYAFVATGRDYPDALSAAAAGGALGAPVLLVNGTGADNLPPAMTNFLKSKNLKKLYIAGGAGAVDEKIRANLSKTWTVERLGGNTRYGTNEKINTMLAGHTGHTPLSGVWIATGTNFPDALSAAAPAGRLNQRLVLSNGSCVPKPVVSSWIDGSKSEVSHVNLVGGTGVLGASVEKLVECK